MRGAPRGRARYLFVSQCFHRIEACREISGNQRGKRADKKRADADNGYVPRNHFCRDRGKLIDLARKDLDVQR